ncbi:MAG: ParB/RepB/Spo0J family partition protein, partial [Nitrososphaerales archaeon]
MEVNIELIKPSPHQPRIIFDLDEIKGSVERDGILVPLTVRKKDDYYELIDGERRWRVSKELGFKTVPCTVIDVDDVTADRMAWKVNTLRRDYGPKEKAYHFREHQKEGSTLRGIADTHDLDQRMVKAYLNVFKLPEKYQELVWNREISIGIILELGSLLNGEYSPLNRPEVLGILDRASKEKYFGARDVREIIKPYLARVRREQVEKAQQTLSEIEPEVKAPETPEEFERASRVLRFEAKKKREELLTPEERAKIEIEKRGKEEERRRRAEERERRLEEEAVRRARQIEEEERRRIEEEARKRAVEEELRRPEVLRE